MNAATAAPGRRRPSPADIADLVAGGLRRRLRTAPGVGVGFRLAGLLALTTTSAFASWWAVLEVLAPRAPWSAQTGPFLSLGVAAWALWLLAAVVHAVASGRWFRRAAVLTVLFTAGVLPAAMLTGIFRPLLCVLLPPVVLGVVALGASARYRWWVRLAPLAAAALLRAEATHCPTCGAPQTPRSPRDPEPDGGRRLLRRRTMRDSRMSGGGRRSRRCKTPLALYQAEIEAGARSCRASARIRLSDPCRHVARLLSKRIVASAASWGIGGVGTPRVTARSSA